MEPKIAKDINSTKLKINIKEMDSNMEKCSTLLTNILTLHGIEKLDFFIVSCLRRIISSCKHRNFLKIIY